MCNTTNSCTPIKYDENAAPRDPNYRLKHISSVMSSENERLKDIIKTDDEIREDADEEKL